MALLILLVLMASDLLPVMGQNSVSAKALQTLFAQSYKQNIGFSNVWKANNEDSAYYKNDTIQLINSVNARLGCYSVEWRMEGKSRIGFTRVHHCREPPVETLIFQNHKLSLRFSDNADFTTLTLGRKSGPVEIFEVLDLKEIILWEGGDRAFQLSLRRIH